MRLVEDLPLSARAAAVVATATTGVFFGLALGSSIIDVPAALEVIIRDAF